MRFAAIVPRMGRIGSFFGPLENRQLRIVAVNNEPPHRIVILSSAYLASITCANHRPTPKSILTLARSNAKIQDC
jgi:hypothetical protein